MLYVVTYCEHERFARAVPYIVGIFDSRQKASVALEQTFHKACDTYLVDKGLNDETQVAVDNSYYNEGKEFSFDYLDCCGDIKGEVFGEIEEIELNKINLDTETDDG